ncbi:MAG: DnaA/Hda family protein [Pseudomonadota bacterium]
MAEQLAFPQPLHTSYAAHDFYEGEASAVARAMLADPATWPLGKLVLMGEAGAGKTHLARMHASRTGAALLDGARDLPDRAETPVIVDDAQAVAGRGEAEEALFHLHNNLAAAGLPLLLVARTPPSTWYITLPDLKSRMEATAIARIEAPDDATLTAILAKLMVDRQLNPAPNLLGYLTRRMGRSYAEAGRIVARLDTLSLAEKREITTALAARVLDADAE